MTDNNPEQPIAPYTPDAQVIVNNGAKPEASIQQPISEPTPQMQQMVIKEMQQEIQASRQRNKNNE